jgi:hypothetical protein
MALTPRDKRMLQILGVVAGLALVFLLVTKVFGGGGGDDGSLAAPTGFTGVVPVTGPTATPTPQASGTLPPVVLAGARDPFSTPPELVSAAPTDTTSTSTSTSPGGTSTLPTTTFTTATSTTSTFTFPTSTSTSTFTNTSTGTFTSTGTNTSTTSPGGDGNNNGEPTNKITIGEHNLKLISTNQKQGRVEIFVDRQLWTVEEGGTFDQVYKLVKIDGKCARFLFGDDSFTLCLTKD